MKPRYIAKPICNDGEFLGWKLYFREGILGMPTFSRYFWTKDWV